jgi:hypothetical protein
MGMGAHAQGNIEEALFWLTKVSVALPAYAECHAMMADLRYELGHFEQALRSLDKAIALKPSDARSHGSRGVLRLLLEDFGGIEDLQLTGELLHVSCDREWTGRESLVGKTILLNADRVGIGDTFQHCRYAQVFADRGAKVILMARPALLDLMQTVPGLDSVIANSSPQAAFDYQIDLMKTVWVLERSAATLYAPNGYMRASDVLKAAWRSRLGKSEKPRVGLAWWTATAADRLWTDDGGKCVVTTPSTGPKRCIPLDDLIRQLPPDFEYVSLQHQVRESDEAALRSSSIAHFGNEMTFDDAAAVASLCDLVIAIVRPATG